MEFLLKNLQAKYGKKKNAKWIDYKNNKNKGDNSGNNNEMQTKSITYLQNG